MLRVSHAAGLLTLTTVPRACTGGRAGKIPRADLRCADTHARGARGPVRSLLPLPIPSHPGPLHPTLLCATLTERPSRRPQSTRPRRGSADQLLRGRRARDAPALPRLDRRAPAQAPQPGRERPVPPAEAVRPGAGHHDARHGRRRERGDVCQGPSSCSLWVVGRLTRIGQHYSAIMPLLLNVMQNANGPEYRKLRVKAMECAGLIGTYTSTRCRPSVQR